MKKIRILSIKPMKSPEVITIEASLEAMHGEVGGYIEAIHPFDDPTAVLVCNEDGKGLGLPLNRCLKDDDGAVCDTVAGTFFICSHLEDGSFGSLTDEQIRNFTETFRFPEVFVRDRNGQINCITICKEVS